MAIAIAPTTGLPAVISDMTPSERRHLGALEKRIAAGLQTFREVGTALVEIRDTRLYRESHGTFEAYCSERWGINRVRAYQLMDSAKVVKALGDPEGLRNEAQAREMVPLVTDDPEVAKRVWVAVEERASASGKPVTASLIRQVRQEVAPPNGHAAPAPREAPPSLAVRLEQDMVRLGATYHRFIESKPSKAELRLINAAKRKLIEALG